MCSGDISGTTWARISEFNILKLELNKVYAIEMNICGKRKNYHNSNNSDQSRDIKEDIELHTKFICE